MDRPAPRTALYDSLGQPWTATRCHRLLRPLLTHISALKKEVNRQRQRESGGDTASQDHAGSILTGGRWSLDGFAASDGWRTGPSANPAKPLSRKRAQHTYSVKASKRPKIGRPPAKNGGESESLRTKRYAIPSEPNVCLATPIVRRIQGQWSSPVVEETTVAEVEVPTKPGRCYHSHQACARRCSFEDRLVSLRTTTPSWAFTLYEAIYRAFDALLRATTASEVQVAKPKSLMAMCLRKVPDYLAELEAWRLQELEESGTSSAFDDTSTSFDVYSDLESLGTGQCGWKHLAAVVQSHGIRIVRDAVSERLMADDFAILLSDLCSELRAVGDWRQLLEAVVTQQHRMPHDHLAELWPRSSQTIRLLLPQQHDCSGTTMLRARLTTDLLSSQLLPQAWLVSETFSSTWSIAMSYLTSRTSYHDAIPFFIASIRLYCNHMQQNTRKSLGHGDNVATAQQQLINSLAMLSTLVLLGQETLKTESDPERRDQTCTLCKRAEYVLRASLASTYNTRGRATRQASTYVLLLAVFLVAEVGSGSRETRMLADFWTRVERDYKQYYEATMALMASVARGCTRKKSASPAHTYLAKLCEKLEVACPEVTALRTIRVDAAFHLADLTGDVWDLNFAEQLAATLSNADMTKTPGRETAGFSGYRWDEGISEWITVTPAVARRKQPALKQADADCCQPQPPSPVFSSKRVLDIEEDNGASEERRYPRRARSARASPEPGTSCRVKRARRQGEAQPTHTKPGVVQTTESRGRCAARATPELEAGGGVGSDDLLDDLRLDQVADDQQENRPPSRRANKACGAPPPLKRQRSRRALISLRPIRNVSNEYHDADESSGDELGIM